MRILSSAVLGIGLLAAACDAPSEALHGKADRGTSNASPAAPATTADASTFTINGHVSGAGNGNTALGTGGPNLPASATSVDVMAMNNDGSLDTVASAPLNADGTFNADVPAGSSPTQIYIIKVKDAVGAIVGSGVVNGFVQGAFFKAFFVDAPIDTQTSFKAQILDTIAKKGVPGVQNYLNVVNTFVNDWVTDSLTVQSVATSDLTNIVETQSDAIIAGEDVIESSLKSAGIPIDLSALQGAQIAAVSGFDHDVMTLEGKTMAADESFFQGLEAATAKAAAPIDQAIFNAVVNGSSAMSHSMKQKSSAHDAQFAMTKSGFAVQTAAANHFIHRLFGAAQPDVLAAIQTGGNQFAAAVGAATTTDELEAAQADFANLLLSKNAPAHAAKAPDNGLLCCLVDAIATDVQAVCAAIEACVAPCLTKLTGVYAKVGAGTTYDATAMDAALVAFDQGLASPPAQMSSAMSSDTANALMQAVGFVQKQAAL